MCMCIYIFQLERGGGPVVPLDHTRQARLHAVEAVNNPKPPTRPFSPVSLVVVVIVVK